MQLEEAAQLWLAQEEATKEVLTPDENGWAADAVLSEKKAKTRTSVWR